eukprot:16426893-Heterocapsa_arctica.AAC.2
MDGINMTELGIVQQRIGGHHGAGDQNKKKKGNMFKRHAITKCKCHRHKIQVHLELRTEQSFSDLEKSAVVMKDKSKQNKV